MAESENESGFYQYDLPTGHNLFDELLRSVPFENVGKGRQGTVLVKPDATRGIPIVRTTTKYSGPAHCFGDIHVRLAEQIEEHASLSTRLNNGLIEHYTNAYTKMGSHSDQALDLEGGSFIAIFSCYKYPDRKLAARTLVAESKEPGGEAFEIPLEQNSLVIFSLNTNRRFKHKIVLATAAPSEENEWLGITFRTSEVFVQFRDKQAYLENGTPLTLASTEQERSFYQMRGRENREIDFSYPRVDFTISESDMMPPRRANP